MRILASVRHFRAPGENGYERRKAGKIKYNWFGGFIDSCINGWVDGWIDVWLDRQRGRRASRQADGEKDREADIIATVTGA